MISVCIVSPAWGRFEITRLVLEQRQRVCSELASRGVDAAHLVVADDANLEIAKEFGGLTVTAPNRPLGAKCNVGLNRAVELGFDFLVWVGSDDWIHPDLFRTLPASVENQPVLWRAGRRIAMVDMATGRLQRLNILTEYGCIPWILDTRMFKRLPVEPIPPDLPRGLDGGLIRGLRLGRVDHTWIFDDPHDFRCVDFKSNQNLTPYDGLANQVGANTPEPAWETLTGWFPADLVEKARSLSERHPGPAARFKEDHKTMRLFNPESGEWSHVSEKGAEVLKARGWIDPNEPEKPQPARQRRKTTK